MTAQILGIDRMQGVLGYVILNEDGAVMNSSGDLKNNENMSDAVLGLLKTIQKGKSVICKDEEFLDVQIYWKGAMYMVFRQAQKICLVKRKVDMDNGTSLI
ncbi:hypothetical protein RvY_00575 [Ramazzottius varieornatus]|uniref:Late endosomal/lysosomal adaptor and MAPK and MTOR activator 4 n=1 Tax=Ramazzottius varieornatus TaxID=947166 RepID=A0A1D1UKH9_RAMVA|nr:hypothetical protein RvY_00575 [Ramazzottius varieornatus]